MALVGLESEQRARSCLDDVAARLDMSRTLHNHQPSPFTHLMIAEFLTGGKADDDRPRSVDGLESGRPTCPLGRVNLFHVPRLHSADSRRSRMVGLALLPEPRPKARNLPTRYGARDVGAQANRIRHAGPALRCFEQASTGANGSEVVMSKSSDKPKKQQKQKAQKTLKERRTEKRAAKKLGSGSFLPAGK